MKGNDMKTAALRPLAGVLALAILPACTAYPDRQQEQAGVVIGAIVGGVLGSQIGHGSGRTVATIVGTMVGAVVGGNIGRSMDQSDRLKTAHSLETVRSQRPVSETSRTKPNAVQSTSCWSSTNRLSISDWNARAIRIAAFSATPFGVRDPN